jgi:hypothetical protein
VAEFHISKDGISLKDEKGTELLQNQRATSGRTDEPAKPDPKLLDDVASYFGEDWGKHAREGPRVR